MNGWDDYLALILSSESYSGTPDELSAYEFGINERYVLDNILKHVDHLICDPDDVTYFEIEAGENYLLEDIRQHFGIDAEGSCLLEDMKARFKGKYPLERKVSYPTHSKVIDSREPVEETCRSFFTKNGQFDWGKWAEAYNSDEDEFPPLPTARVLKKRRRKSRFKWELCLLLFDTAHLLLLFCLACFAVC